RFLRTRRQRATLATLGSGIAVAAALAIVFGTVLGPSRAGTEPLLAGFEARSYAPGQTAVLDIDGGTTDRTTLQLFLAGSPGTPTTSRTATAGTSPRQSMSSTSPTPSPAPTSAAGSSPPGCRSSSGASTSASCAGTGAAVTAPTSSPTTTSSASPARAG